MEVKYTVYNYVLHHYDVIYGKVHIEAPHIIFIYIHKCFLTPTVGAPKFLMNTLTVHKTGLNGKGKKV